MSQLIEQRTTEPVLLNYGRAAAWYRRWRWRKIILWAVIACVVGAVAIYWEPVRRKSKVLYHQRHCLDYSLPQTQVVYEEDPAAMGKLLAMGKNFETLVPMHQWSHQAVVNRPECWRLYAKAGFRWGVIPDAPILFLHELQNKAGMKRLVCVWLSCKARFDVETEVIEPAGFTTPPAVVSQVQPPIVGWFPAPDNQQRNGIMRFYCGQVSAADPSRFTINYEWDSKKGSVSGRLSDEGNKVILEFTDESWRRNYYVVPTEVLKSFKEAFERRNGG